MEREHGSPYYHVHRADLHTMLLDLALSSPSVKLRLNSTVESVNASAPSIKLTSGQVLKADLIIGADGVKSMCRSIVLGAPTTATATGDAVYRAIVPTDAMLADPDLRPFVENPEMTAWMGPGRHIMAYNIVSSSFSTHCSSPLFLRDTSRPCTVPLRKGLESEADGCICLYMLSRFLLAYLALLAATRELLASEA